MVSTMRLSALMQVYNEELCLPCSLGTLVPIVDELIIIDGSENGPSTDNSSAIINSFMAKYPDKIVYLSGTYSRDGVWDEASQVNEGYGCVTGDFVMRTHADIIYDTEDLVMVREIIDRHPDSKYFYAPYLEFYCDTDHVILSSYLANESCLPRDSCGDVVAVAMSLEPHFEDFGEYGRSALIAAVDWVQDIIYMPHVKRFHYAYVKSFEKQVEKLVKYIMNGECGQLGEELKALGSKEVLGYAIEQVDAYAEHPGKYPFAGKHPKAGEPLREMTIGDGREEFVRSNSLYFVCDHSTPSKPDYPSEPPTSEEIASGESEIVDLLPAVDGTVAGMARHERFMAELIAHHYSDADLIDLGCGNGKFLACLLRDGYIAAGTAVDAVPGVLENARQTLASIGREIPLIASTIEDLELETRYDVVLCVETLEHLYNANSGVQKARSLMRPMGMFCGTVPLGNTCDCERHKHYFTEESLSKLLNDFFNDVTISVMDFTGDGELHLLFSCRSPK